MEETAMKKFLDKTKSDDKVCDIYKKIRIWLQSEGHTTETSKRISQAPEYVWGYFHNLTHEIDSLKNTLRRYSILEDDKELNDYIQKKFIKIDKKFPLIDEL